MNKIIENVIEKLSNDIFTDRDIALLFPGSADHRYGLIKRAIKSKGIIRLKRGLYCLARKYQRRGVNLYYFAEVVSGPSYVSVTSALSYHGWIPEGVFMTTCVSMHKSIIYTTPLGTFVYSRVPQNYFYEDVERVVTEGGVFFMARPWKALCDYVYVHKKMWQSIDPLIKSLRIDEENLINVSSDEYDRLYKNYRNKRVRLFIKGVRKELGL